MEKQTKNPQLPQNAVNHSVLDLDHLLPYLNYKVKFYVFDDPNFEKKYLDEYPNGQSRVEVTTENYKEKLLKGKYKMILQPLSNFGNSDDLRKVHEFIGLGKWCDAYDNYFKIWFDDLANIDKLILQAPYDIFKYFLANHYDVFGLIKKGHAIYMHDV